MSQNQIGIVHVHGHPDNYLPQWCGKKSVSVTFDRPFDIKPRVCASITLIDSQSRKDLRINVSCVHSISPTACTIDLESWGNSQIWNVIVSWIASDDPNFLCGVESFEFDSSITSLNGLYEIVRVVPFDKNHYNRHIIN
eukprot:gene66108-90465_t